MKALFRAASGLLAGLMLLFAAVKTADAADKKDCLRLHVLANSDSPEDQRVKLMVRDAILELMRAEEPRSKQEAMELMLDMGGELLSAAEEVLAENGLDYGVRLMAGRFEFPERDYSGDIYPAGEYDALRVILGSGGGRNWWCVMFPPLCVIDDGSGISQNPNGTLEFRSIILDFLRSIFG